mgnify:CR=1 FL=1
MLKKKNVNTNILSLINPIKNTYHSTKINNKFKKSSTINNHINNKSQNNNNNFQNGRVNSINNNIYLNLFNKFNNTSTLHKNVIGPKQIISSRINSSHISKDKKNINMLEIPSASSIKRKNNYPYDSTSLINSMNFVNNHSHINIRLNLKNQFINNSNNNFNNSASNNYLSDINEQIKEKDLKIILLKNELLKSKEIINQFQINNNLEINKYNFNLNNSSQEKNLCLLTKSSESVDKVIKTAFNGYTSNLKNKKNQNCKNSFLKSHGNKNIMDCLKKSKTKEKYDKKKKEKDINNYNNNIYSGNNKKKQSDYLKLFLPLSNIHNEKHKYNSYSNNKKNIKNIMNTNSEPEIMNKTEKNKSNHYNNGKYNNTKNKENEEFYKFTQKCEELKKKTRQLLNNFINLGEFIQNSKLKK